MAKRLNRHALMRKHKRNLKKKFGYGLYTGYRTNTRLMEDEYRREYGDRVNSRNGGYNYWKHVYLSGLRSDAKHNTNRAIRAMYRDMLNVLDHDALEDIQIMNGSDYEKIYDYDWYIW